jgi:hypothetical protein
MKYRRKRARRNVRCVMCTFRDGNGSERHTHHSQVARDPLNGVERVARHKVRVDARSISLDKLDTSLDTE